MNAPSILESRAFVFGKMKNEGVPLVWATVISAFFFAYLHSTNPGFGILPLLSIFIVGILYVLSYHYFGTIWFTCTAHMMWNFTQDFIFGLPDSGKPAAASVFSTTVTGSSFFYDEAFGIEGSWMAILVNLPACILIFLIGRDDTQMTLFTAAGLLMGTTHGNMEKYSDYIRNSYLDWLKTQNQRYPLHDFDSALIASVNHKGDSDSTGAVCGNILGARLGDKGIPEKYTTNMEVPPLIILLENRLAVNYGQ